MPFAPLLAGASLRDRLVASTGALVSIALTGAISAALLHNRMIVPWLVAPMGASAVLVFAVPASPLAQPWAVIGGNVLSALVGVAAARWIPVPFLAAGVAVGGAILLMSLSRCLHPPGGAAALTAVIGGPVIASAGYGFAFVPVGLNAALLTLLAFLFHRISGHSYPHRAVPVAGHVLAETSTEAFDPRDIEQALADLGETFDVSREDLDLLFRQAELHAAARRALTR